MNSGNDNDGEELPLKNRHSIGVLDIPINMYVWAHMYICMQGNIIKILL